MVEYLRRRWRARHERALSVQGKAQAVNQRVTAWSKFIRYSQQSLSLGAGALLVIDGQLTPGGMIAASVLIGRALAPLDMLVSNWRVVVNAYAAFGRLETLLQQFAPPRNSGPQEAPSGAVELRNVVARAPGREEAILKNIGFSVPAGTVVALLGPSGSGKSTLARAMVGIWPDLGGEVLLDGRPISSWDRRQLGPHLGYLPQDVELFAGTIAENIARLGTIDSPMVIAAARCAGLHEMILRLPSGYDTPIGEAGAMLSAGQRQRIALARAVYGEPALVVLDEPNANLDDAGEAALMNTVAQLKAKGRTVMLITHRPMAVGAADWLLLLNQGELVASGTREEVLAAIAVQHKTPAPPSGASPLAPQPA